MLSGKCVYPYEYYKLEKFNETSLPKKKDLYSNLNTVDITDADYINKKKICQDFEIKILVEYYDLHFKSNTLLLADAFENFKKLCRNLSISSCKTSFRSRLSIARDFKKD